MLTTRNERRLFWFTLGYVTLFCGMALTGSNHEFLLYAAVILIAGATIVTRQHKVRFPFGVLCGLSLWGLLHMAGGNLLIHGTKLYDYRVIPLVGEPYYIVGYDHVVHALGFGVATLACHHVLCAHLVPSDARHFSVLVLTVLMGLGVGAVNELVEFAAVLIMPETGVGGYENTLLDMVANTVGAVIAAISIRYGRKQTAPSQQAAHAGHAT